MQLSAANLLIASQQIARSVIRPSPDAQAQFTQALAKEKGVQSTDAFEPMDFKRSASAAVPAAPAAPARTPSAGYAGTKMLGGNIDIRV